jgi:hypothetical protein
MRAPSRRGAAVDDARFDGWLDRFRFYRHPPNKTAIQSWLNRFANGERDLAARILDCVEVIPDIRIQEGYQQALRNLPGWNTNKQERDGNWFFVGFGDAGESGPSMVRTFREANHLTAERYDYLFCNILEIPSKKLTAADTIVFIDDFSGTGRQVCKKWRIISELIATDAQCFLILTAATDEAIRKIQQETELTVRVKFRIQNNENIFAASCQRFNAVERQALLPYCTIADAKEPMGFGGCGLLYVLSHKTPNNSVPILHANHRRWHGLFPRYLQAAE